MSYYQRSPEEVQWANRHEFDFEKIAKHYESIKPLRGKRASKNIRPVGERNRDWERVVKVSDDEYYLTNSAYRWYDDPNHNTSNRVAHKLMSFKRFDGGESFTLRTPVWHTGRIDPNQLGVSSTFYFIKFNLPHGLSFHNERSCKYIRTDHDDKYYTAEKGDITFTRLNGQTEWKPLVVYPEVVHHTDRSKTKKIREQMKPFLEYSEVMFDILEYKSWWGGTVFRQEVFAEYTWEDVINPMEDGSPNPLWVDLVERMKYKAKFYNYDTRGYEYSKVKFKNELYKDICYIARPHKEIEIPLGTTCRDPFKTMYR